jgi:hypothetical protein
MTLAHLVYRIASDPSFAAQFAKEPHATLLSSGIVLDHDAGSAALAVLADSERTRRLCLPNQETEGREWYSPQRQA